MAESNESLFIQKVKNRVTALKETNRFYDDPASSESFDAILNECQILLDDSPSSTSAIENQREAIDETVEFLKSRSLWPLPPPTPVHHAPKKANPPLVESEPPPTPPDPKVVEKPIISKKGQVNLLSEQEFVSVPKYMKGRLSLNDINCFIGTFNSILADKYILMQAPFKRLGKTDKDRVIGYRDQENDDTKGRYFCIQNDLKDIMSPKEMQQFFKIVPILRHCKRIVEIRGSGLTRLAAL